MQKFGNVALQAYGFAAIISFAILGTLFGANFNLFFSVPSASLMVLIAAIHMFIGSNFPRPMRCVNSYYILIFSSILAIFGIITLFFCTSLFLRTIGACAATLSASVLSFFIFRIIGALDFHDQSLYMVLAFCECGIIVSISALLPKTLISFILIFLWISGAIHTIIQCKSLKISFLKDETEEIIFEEGEKYIFSRLALFTTCMTGFVWAGAISSLFLSNIGFFQAHETLGVCFFLTAVIMLVDRKIGPYLGEDLLLKVFPLFTFFFFIVYPIASGTAKIIVVCLTITLFTCDVIVNMLAIAEVARFNQISPALSFGKSLFFFFLGAFFGIVLFVAIAPQFNQMINIAFFYSCYFCILIVSIFMFKNNFPEESDAITVVLASTPPLDKESDSGNSFPRKSDWKQRTDYIAEKYHLTSRQKEVFCMLLKGRNAQFIANDFVISYSTAKAHIHSIYTKLDIHSQQELISLVENAPISEEQ